MLPKETCVGCAACTQVCPKKCITMIPDAKGFLHPCIDEAVCVKCGACEKACQVLHTVQKNPAPQKVYAARVKDKSMLRKSSSGGIASMLAEEFIRRGGIVYGAAFDEQMIVRHIRVSEVTSLDRLQGSKYVQSDIQEIYAGIKKDLVAGKNVLLFGTPCQIAGARKIFGEEGKLLLCDLICHSAPSPKIFAEHLKAIEAEGKKVADYRFRDKTYGWSYNLNRIIYQDGSSELHSYWNQCYKRLFLLNLIARESCYTCRYSDVRRVGDITLGDFWGIDRITNQFADDDGVNAVFINTEKGKEAFETELQKNVEYKETAIADALQEHLIMPCTRSGKVDAFWNCYQKKSYKNAAEQFAGGYNYLTIRNRVKDFLREHRLLRQKGK